MKMITHSFEKCITFSLYKFGFYTLCAHATALHSKIPTKMTRHNVVNEVNEMETIYGLRIFYVETVKSSS